MELMTVRDQILNVVTLWKAQYPQDVPLYGGTTSSGKILAALQALDLRTCGADAIDAIIGNASWTTLRCGHCHKSVPSLVVLGYQHQDEHGFPVCQDCLVKALDLFRDAEVPSVVPGPAQTRPI